MKKLTGKVYNCRKIKVLLISLVFILTTGCYNSKNQIISTDKAIEIEEVLKVNCDKKFEFDSLGIFNTISRRDTLYSPATFIKYGIVDSVYAVMISINNIDSILDFRFDKNSFSGLVPKLYKFFSNKILLIRGTGFTYREILCVELLEDKLFIERFETSISEISCKDLIVYKESVNSSILIIEEIGGGYNAKIKLEPKFIDKKINEINVYDDEISVHFINQEYINIKLDYMCN